MSDTAEALKQKLEKQIDTARAKLDAMKREITDIHDEDLATLSQHQDQIRTRLDQQRSRAQQLQDDIASWKNEKVSHTKEAVASWKQKREVRKLEARADRAESYAIDMVTYAALDFEQAEQAVLDALAARLEANAASISA
jgi:TolA-binding protein